MRAAMVGAWLALAPLSLAAGSVAAQSADAVEVVFPQSASQGALVIGKVPAGSQVQYAGRSLRVSG
ncbi:M23 family peptidase, partial [Xanthomonas citri pv. citri]|nr:M23 family peptidase [Xanthomonas citri pv. citri]